MKQIQIGFFFLLLFSFGLKAQQNYFIYIQTENKQSFYVKLENKLYSSSASGYIVLPKLTNGVYNLAVGFPKSEWAEQNMICTIDNSDIGFLLKNFGSKGWGLFNLQTMNVVMSAENAKVDSVVVVNNTDAFSNMLSNVVNDSTIRQTETVKETAKVPVKEVEKATPVIIETATVLVPAESSRNEVTPSESNKSTINPPVTGDSIKSGAGVSNKQESGEIDTRSSITRSLFNKNTDGTEMVFIDELNGKRDTIIVFIPADKNSEKVPAIEKGENHTDKSKELPKSESVNQESKSIDSRFLDIELPASGNKMDQNKPNQEKAEENRDSISLENKDNLNKKPIEPVSQKSPMINSDCKSFASDEDFLKLRKKMAGENEDDQMITIAKKYFKTKCFTVDQVKNLSVLFLKESGKYAFFDMAYPFVSDSHNFSKLQSQLSETYYINRFQVMIRQ